MTHTDDLDNDAALRFAGSEGDVDLEYTPRPDRIICGSDDHYATKLDMVALAETVLIAVDTDMDKERKRLGAIEERMADVVQRLRNLEAAE